MKTLIKADKNFLIKCRHEITFIVTTLTGEYTKLEDMRVVEVLAVRQPADQNL